MTFGNVCPTDLKMPLPVVGIIISLAYFFVIIIGYLSIYSENTCVGIFYTIISIIFTIAVGTILVVMSVRHKEVFLWLFCSFYRFWMLPNIVLSMLFKLMTIILLENNLLMLFKRKCVYFLIFSNCV